MIFGSVCSGIEAASVAWSPLGWRAAFVSEIDPAASAVLAHHYHDVPNLGDMTRFQEWPDAALDVLCGGTPCQSFSVAGLRGGLADPRGNLALTFLAIADRYRPRWVVWENVLGLLSSDGGRDFAAFLGGLGQLGYGWAYRVLDAQYVRVDGYPHAVPQRRRRVFVVGCLGSWASAAAVLFEPENLRGHSPPRREAGTGVAVGVIKGAAIGRQPHNGPQRGDHLDDGSCYTLTTNEVHAVAYGGNRTGKGDSAQCVATAWAVRRLTPLETARLQGFPDDYFDGVRYRGKPLADGPIYKMLGNSWAIPPVRWIGRRIDAVEALRRELLVKEAAE